VRFLIVGAEGQLGAALVRLLGERVAWSGGRATLDIRDEAAVRLRVTEVRPDVVINASAYNKVDAAESEPGEAFAVNALGPRALGRAARQAGALLVHVSTDYVFDGEAGRPYIEADLPRPISAYGVSKLAGEHFALAAGGEALVVRTSGVFGGGGSRAKGGSFVERILARAASGQPLRVVTDQVFSPTYAPDLAAALLALVERGARGLVHVSNAGACSWHDVASEALRLRAVNAPIERIGAAALALPARRPAFSVLSNARCAALGLPLLRPWQEALADFLA
jgi:dTDP-4-dehydrorhamnose reductase